MGRVRGEGGETEAGKGWEREKREVGGRKSQERKETDKQADRQKQTK